MTQYKIIAKDNGKFGVQRVGSNEVFGNMDSFAEAVAAIGEANIAQEVGLSDAMHY